MCVCVVQPDAQQLADCFTKEVQELYSALVEKSKPVPPRKPAATQIVKEFVIVLLVLCVLAYLLRMLVGLVV